MIFELSGGGHKPRQTSKSVTSVKSVIRHPQKWRRPQPPLPHMQQYQQLTRQALAYAPSVPLLNVGSGLYYPPFLRVADH
jgi:hypothetical protein